MKCFCQLIVLLSILSGAVYGGEGKHLFILSGQSNMGGLKPEVSFTPAVTKAFGADNIIVVKHAKGGQPIREWYKEWKPSAGKKAPKGENGKIYNELMEKVKEAVGANQLATITFIWMQGERDAKEGHADVYEVSYKGLMAQLEADLQRKDINHVIGRLSDSGKSPDWNLIREIEVKLAEENPNVEWVDTDDLNGDKNDLHMTREGYATMGERFAEKAILLVNKQIKK